jgi:hypothetical protein
MPPMKPTKAPRPVRTAMKKEVIAKAAASAFTGQKASATQGEKGKYAVGDASARSQAQRSGVRPGTVARLATKGMRLGAKVAQGKVKGMGGSDQNLLMSEAAEKNTSKVKAATEKKAAVKAQTKAAKTYAKPFNAKKQK